MAIAVYTIFSPPRYYARVVMNVSRSAQPINFERAPVSLVHLDLSPVGYVGVATAIAFITGLTLVSIALFVRSKDSDNHTKRA